MKTNFTTLHRSLMHVKFYMIILISTLVTSTVKSQVSVTATIGALTGTYSTIKETFDSINSGYHRGVIQIQLTGNTIESSICNLNGSGIGPAVYSSVTITPTGGAARSITGNVGAALIQFFGTSNVTINGLNTGGNSLTIENISTSTNASTINLIGDVNNCNILNSTILGASSASTTGTINIGNGNILGNSMIFIYGCNISNSGANFPVNAIRSAGLSGTVLNSSIVIDSNNISNYFNPTISSSGVLCGANNNAITITRNRFFQTTTLLYTGANTHSAISISSGAGHNVSNNIIGYANASGTGTTNMIGNSVTLTGFPGSYTVTGTANATRYIAINLTMTSISPASIINGNVIAGFALYTSSGATTANGIFCGIQATNGNYTISGNTIGATTGQGSIYTATTTSGGTIVGIYTASTAGSTIQITNNTMGAWDAMGTTPSICGGITGINSVGTSVNYTINNNVIGNTTPQNLRMGNLTLSGNLSNVGTTFSSATGIGAFNGILNAATGNIIIGNSPSTGNTIRNIAHNTTSTNTARGIANTAATQLTVMHNNINNITSATSSTSVANALTGLMGIHMQTGILVSNIANNIVTNLSIQNTGAIGSTVTGIGVANSTFNIYNNQIYGLTNASTSTSATAPGVACGVLIRSGAAGTTINIYNNMISLGFNSTNNTAFIGVYANHGSTPDPTDSIFNNTIYIGGTVTSGAQPSFGIYRGDFSATARTVNMRIYNNLIVNLRSGGTGIHTCLSNNFGATTPSSTGWLSNASNNNLLNANPTTVANWGTVTHTMSSWRSFTGGDLASFSNYPVTFVDSSNNLHLNMGTTPTVAESYGMNLSSFITTDIDNQNRPGPSGSVNGGALGFDIGADEFDGVPLDVSAPVINYTLISNTGVGTSYSLPNFATITDFFTGVDTGITKRPRIYYKKRSHANAFVGNTSSDNGWKFVAASNTSSPYSFTLNFSILFGGGVVVGDTIDYFVVAQDSAATPNVSALPSAGFVGTSVSAITSAPTTPNTFYIVTPLPTNINVGIGQAYTSLTGVGGLFDAINTAVLAGNTTVNITSDLEENGAVQLLNIGLGGYTLTIQPSAAAVRNISNGATMLTVPMIGFNGAQNVVIDGRFSGSGNFLRFVNYHTTQSSTTPSIAILGNASSITIRNCLLQNTTTSATAGTVLIGTGTNTISNIHFINNIFSDTSVSASPAASPARHIFINSPNVTNVFIGGPAPADSNTFINYQSNAILANNCGDAIFIRNNMFYQTKARTTAVTAVSLLAGSQHFIIRNAFFDQSIFPTTQTFTAINIAAGNGHLIMANSIGGSNRFRQGNAFAINATTACNIINLNVGFGLTTNVMYNSISNLGMISTTGTPTLNVINVAAGNVEISDNIIGGGANPWDTIQNGYDNGLINVSGTATFNIKNNTISNANYWRASGDRHSAITINSATANGSITGNHIHTLSANSTGGIASNFSLFGIFLNGNNVTVDSNLIYKLTNTSTSSSYVRATGINVSTITATGTYNITRNRIYNLSANGTGTGTNSPGLLGIHIHGGTGAINIINNQITIDPPAPYEYQAIGISHNSGSLSSLEIYYNSIYIGGFAVGTSFSYGFYRNVTGVTTRLRNNFIYNGRNGMTSKHFAVGSASSTVTGFSNSNNLMITFNPAEVAEIPSSTFVPLAGWNSITSGTANLYNTTVQMPVNHAFSNYTFTNGDLTSDHCRAYQNGTPIMGVNTDYYALTRSNTTPSIGSSEITSPSGYINIITQPATPAVACGSIPQTRWLKVNATGYINTYRWEVNMGFGWMHIALDTAVYSGTSTDSLVISGLLAGYNGYQYRCILQGICNTDTTVVRTLTVQQGISSNFILSAPQTICSGSVPTTIVGSTPSGGSGTYVYEWLKSTISPTTGFTAIPSSNTINFSPAALTDTTYYRRVVSSGVCPNDTTLAYHINVNPAITSNTASGTSPVCNGTSTVITGSTPSGGTGTYSYLWLNSTTSATSGFSPASGMNTAINYFTPVLTTTNWYRRVVTSGACTDTSSAFQVNITNTNTWTGTASSAWGNPSNWSCGVVPTSSTDVVINSGAPNMPIITDNRSVNSITVNTGAMLTLNGVTASITIPTTFVVNGTFNAILGTVIMNGSSVQSLPATTYHNLEINNSTFVQLTGTTTINGNVNFVNGNLTLHSHDLILAGTTSSITGAGFLKCVVTNGNGALKIANVGPGGRTGAVLFPVGGNFYLPATITNTGTLDTISVRVSTNVLSNGLTGSTITSGAVNQTWILGEGTPGGSNLSVTLQWTSSNELPGFNRTSCYVAYHNGSNWIPATAGAAGGSDPYLRSRSGLAAMGAYGVGSGGVLPVVWLHADAVLKNKVPVISWSTANEMNNDYFVVLHSFDGVQFEESGRVDAKGNSNTVQHYTFQDKLVADLLAHTNKTVYYKVRQVDMDGSWSETDKMMLKYESLSGYTVQVSPNPFSTTTSLYINANANVNSTIEVKSINGKILYQMDVKLTEGLNKLDLNMLDQLASGVYILHISTGDGNISAIKMVKQ